jgi:membrane protease YdiL (CAAX protease family)
LKISKTGKMAAEPKTLSAGKSATPAAGNVNSQTITIATGLRRHIVWSEIVIVFVLLELALWAPTHEIRNRWAAAAAIALLAVTVIDVLLGRQSLQRMGLGLPKLFGASVVLVSGVAASAFLITLVSRAGGQVPANPAWFPTLQSTWGYVLWALIQEFILQSFFFNRWEELYGSSAAVWIASALFAAVHLPSPVLTVGTLIGALFFCEMFRRYRSIYPLAIVHAMMGVTIAFITPDSLLHHMRVGLGYLRY